MKSLVVSRKPIAIGPCYVCYEMNLISTSVSNRILYLCIISKCLSLKPAHFMASGEDEEEVSAWLRPVWETEERADTTRPVPGPGREPMSRPTTPILFFHR